MKPVTSLLVRQPECVGDPLIRNSCEFLNNDRQRNKLFLARADQHYISQGSVSLAQSLQMAGLRFASLENRLAPLDPFIGGCGSQEDSLSLKAAGAGVGDYSSLLISTEKRDGSLVNTYRCN